MQQPTVDEVEREFRRQYIFVNKKKPSATKENGKAANEEKESATNSKISNVKTEVANGKDVNNNRKDISSEKPLEEVIEKPKLKLTLKPPGERAGKKSPLPKDGESAQKKTIKENRKNNPGTPTITLDDLRDPQAFEKMVAGLEDAIATEKKKKTSKSKKITEPKGDDNRLKSVSIKAEEKENEREWSPPSPSSASPPRPVTPRRRIPSFKCGRKASGDERKPPIPNEKSPPPPDLEDRRAGGAGLALPPSSPVPLVNGQQQHEAEEVPRRNDVVSSPVPPELTGFTQVMVTAPPDVKSSSEGNGSRSGASAKVDKATQTEGRGSKTCCCSCHAQK